MVYIKEYELQGKIVPSLKDYSRIMRNCLVVSVNKNRTIILVKKDGLLLIGETKDDVIKTERGLEGMFGDNINSKDIELEIP
ncbi:MAG: hypothetical protein WC584_04795 [Candidatus Pacearchaeota archaeon]